MLGSIFLINNPVAIQRSEKGSKRRKRRQSKVTVGKDSILG